MDIINDLASAFKDSDFKDNVLTGEAIFNRLDTTLSKLGWEISYSELEEMFSCYITIHLKDSPPISKTGLGATIAEARADAAGLWGMKGKDQTKIEDKKQEQIKPVTKTTGLLTQERCDKMREIKAKLRITENEQFGPHLNKWSKDKIESIMDLKESNVDDFIEYMMINYIRPLDKMKYGSAQSGGMYGALSGANTQPILANEEI
jgi:hypothetical protein